jgi:hypothetical protein
VELTRYHLGPFPQSVGGDPSAPYTPSLYDSFQCTLETTGFAAFT